MFCFINCRCREQRNWHLFIWKCHSVTAGRAGAPPGRLHRMYSVKTTVSRETTSQNASVRVLQSIRLPRWFWSGRELRIYTKGIKFIPTGPWPAECDQVRGIKVTSARLPARPDPGPLPRQLQVAKQRRQDQLTLMWDDKTTQIGTERERERVDGKGKKK